MIRNYVRKHFSQDLLLFETFHANFRKPNIPNLRNWSKQRLQMLEAENAVDS